MNLTLNGESREVAEATTVATLLDTLQDTRALPTLEGLAVLRNGSVVRRADWCATVLLPGDELEVVRAAVGG